jgi:hypothetical protein
MTLTEIKNKDEKNQDDLKLNNLVINDNNQNGNDVKEENRNSCTNVKQEILLCPSEKITCQLRFELFFPIYQIIAVRNSIS